MDKHNVVYSYEVKGSESLSVVSDSLRPLGNIVHGILQARILEWVAFPFSRGSSQPRDRTLVSHIAGGFFTSWAMREAKNNGVGSLFLPQRLFPTQELNQGLLHCRWILYQLRDQESPWFPLGGEFLYVLYHVDLSFSMNHRLYLYKCFTVAIRH